MGLFSRLKAKPGAAEQVAAEHAVIARYQLPPGPTGTATDGQSLFRLEERLIEAIRDARAGELDDFQFGSGEVTLFAYGPDADRLFAAMEPVLRDFPPRPAQALLRYGGLHDVDVPEVVVHL
jgi:hypothetical protein